MDSGLTPLEIWVLCHIDSYDDGRGVVMGTTSIATASGLTSKETKPILKSLYEKGAIQVTLNDENQKVLHPILKADYTADNRPIQMVKPKKTETIDFAEIQEQWNKTNPHLTPVTRMTAVRKRKIKATLNGNECGVEELIKAFKIVSTISFLQGSQPNSKWKADFDWVIGKPQTLTRILEGQYSKTYEEKRSYDAIMHGNRSQQYYDDDDTYR